MKKIIGVLGGMGPGATADLFLKIIHATPAALDQEHLRIIVDNNPQIPDRTAAIMGQGPDPLPFLVDTAKNLIKAGAEFIVMPCHTAHYYYENLQKYCSIPIVNMIEECAQYALKSIPGLLQVGLLASKGTIIAGLYDRVFNPMGVQVFSPSGEQLESIMKVIYGVKEGRPIGELVPLWLPLVDSLVQRKVQALILGCTELPLAIDPIKIAVPVLDPTDILAKRAVEYALEQD